MRDKILAHTAHVSVFLNDASEIKNWREIETNLKQLKNVRTVSATTYESAVVGGAQTTSYAILRAVENQASKIENKSSSSPDAKIEVAIGKELAEKLNLKIGDAAEIIRLENESAPRAVKVSVKEIFQTGLYEYDSTWVRLSFEDFAALQSGKDFTPTVLSISVEDIYKANETAGEIRKNLGGNFKVVDWQEANQPLFAALSLERKVALAIISLIIFIAALNITTTLALLVNERRLDIAVLKTCGARAGNLIFIFLLEGSFLGFSGIFCGVVLGLLGCFAGNYFRVVNLSAEVYSLNYIPFHPYLINILLIIFIAFLLCLAAIVYPAWKASRIKPLENLRRQ